MASPKHAAHRCEYCRAPEAIFNLPFEVEHIVPTSRGGSADELNHALACRACNVFKSNQLEGHDEVEGKSVRLYHPRQDSWEEHFRWTRQPDSSPASRPSLERP